MGRYTKIVHIELWRAVRVVVNHGASLTDQEPGRPAAGRHPVGHDPGNGHQVARCGEISLQVSVGHGMIEDLVIHMVEQRRILRTGQPQFQAIHQATGVR